MLRPLLALLACAVIATTVFLPATPTAAQPRTPWLEPAARPFDFYARGPYRADIVRPAALLGYEPGEFHTGYANFERVLAAWAAKSDRLKVTTGLRTPEYRPLYTLVVSAPRNLARLDRIRADLALLADPRRAASPGEIERLVRETPGVVWLQYSIHGDESAAFEAAMQVIYQLLASDDPQLVAALEQLVIVVNPCQNPDGHARFVAWYNAHGIGRPETFAHEKREPWDISGRFNHFFFDLNRDMLASSQVESQHAMRAFLEWLPQVSADHHGETKEYFFPPAALPVNPNVPREKFDRWGEAFGRGNAAAFDAFGWQFYVRDVFDAFYPGYWDVWPSLHGATGMTYETSGGGGLGKNEFRDDGTTVTLRLAIAQHFIASLATIETAAANREARLRDFRRGFELAIEKGRTGPVRQFVLAADGDAVRTAELVRLLLRNGLEITRASEPFTAPAHPVLTDVLAPRTFPAGSLVIDLAQPRGPVARALLERESAQDAEFLRRQEDMRARNERRGKDAPREDFEFYDLTAWSLPLAFQLEVHATTEAAAVRGARVTAVEGHALRAGDASFPLVARTAPERAARSAYVFAPDTDGAQRLALTLLQEGYRVATSLRPLRAGGRDYPRGTLIVRVERNPATLHARLANLASDLAVTVDAVDTAFTDTGITGIGSEAVISLRAPKVAVAVREPVRPTAYGAVRFLFEKRFGLQFVPVPAEDLGTLRLADFNVVILPDGDAGDYRSTFGEKGLKRLRAWVEEGGTLVAIGGAAELAAHPKVNLTSARLVGAEEEAAEGDEPADAKPGTKSDAQAGDTKAAPEKPLSVPGAIARAAVNRDHFLTFGLEQDELPVLIAGEAFFTASTTGVNVLTFAQELERPVHAAGFFWKDNTEELLRGTSWVIDETHGAGRVVLFGGQPGFRGFFLTLDRLFLNAVLYGPAVNRSPGDY